MPDDQEGRSEAQNTADSEQGGDPVLVGNAEGQVLQGKQGFWVSWLIFRQDYVVTGIM